MARRRLQIGDRVRLTGDFLRSTGQYTGDEGLARWTVTACPCRLCGYSGHGDRMPQYVAVDQPSADDPTHARHICASNLERCRS